MKAAVTIILSAFALGTVQSSPGMTLRQQEWIKIDIPIQNDRVAVRSDVVGKTSEKKATVWVIVQPRETGDCWVQTSSIADSEGNWRVMAQFGEEAGEHAGRPYEIRALARPKGDIKTGKTACWPEAAVYSDPVYVTRK